MNVLSFLSALVVVLVAILFGSYVVVYHGVQWRRARAARVYLQIGRQEFARELDNLVREVPVEEQRASWRRRFAGKWVKWDAEVVDVGAQICVTGLPMRDGLLRFPKSLRNKEIVAGLRKGLPVKISARLSSGLAGSKGPFYNEKTVELIEVDGKELSTPVKQLTSQSRQP